MIPQFKEIQIQALKELKKQADYATFSNNYNK